MCAQKYIADKSVHKNMYQTKVWTKIYRGQKLRTNKKLMTDKRDDGF